MSQTLYDKDFQLWIDETIASLKNRDFDALDIEPKICPFSVEQILDEDFYGLEN